MGSREERRGEDRHPLGILGRSRPGREGPRSRGKAIVLNLTSRKPLLLLAGGACALLGAGFWVLVTPDNPLTRLFRRPITETDAHVVVGPYPIEEDFKALRDHQVTTIVSLLDSRLPYEKVLLDQEKQVAARYGFKLLNFPMASVLGHPLGSDYKQRVERAAEAIAATEGKVYLHCYLGLHRAEAVQALLRNRGARTATYLLRQAERSQDIRLLDQAHRDYEEGRCADALAKLGKIEHPDAKTLLLRGWVEYRLGDIPAARDLFDEVLRISPDLDDARIGRGYCALREGQVATAEEHFAVFMKAHPADPTAAHGLGLVRYRQGRLEEAARFLRTAHEADPADGEIREILDEIARRRSARGD